MDLTLTLKGKHSGESIDIEIRDISVLIERQTWDYPGSIDIDYSGIFIVSDSEEDEELDKELAKLYEDFIDTEIIEAWENQDPY
jgi:hypothetical protein